MRYVVSDRFPRTRERLSGLGDVVTSRVAMPGHVRDLTGSSSMRELATIEKFRAATGYVGELATLETFRAVGLELVKRTDAKLGLIHRAEAILDLILPPVEASQGVDLDGDADSDEGVGLADGSEISAGGRLAIRASRVPRVLSTHVLRTLSMRLSRSATLNVTILVAQDTCHSMLQRLRVTNLWQVLAQVHLAEAKRLAETPWDRRAVAATASRLALLLGGIVETAKDRSPVAAKATRLACLLGERVLRSQPAALLLGDRAAQSAASFCSLEAEGGTTVGDASVFDPSAPLGESSSESSTPPVSSGRQQSTGDSPAQFRLVVKNSFIEFVEEPANFRRSKSADNMLDMKARRIGISDPFTIMLNCVGSEGATTPAPSLTPGHSSTQPAVPEAAESRPIASESPSPPATDLATSSSSSQAQATSRLIAEPSVEAAQGPEEELRTTVMMRGVPTSYTRTLVLALLDDAGFRGRYDFVYLPIDFTRGIGLGYALVSLLTPEIGQELIDRLTGFRDWAVPSDSVCQASWSEPRQGYSEHLERYRNSPVMHPSVPDEYKPAIFSEGKQIPFPPPTKAIRPPRIRHLKPGVS